MSSIDPKISVGNIIQIGVLLVAVLAAWFTLDNRVTAAAIEIEELLDDIAALKASDLFIHSDVETRTRLLELAEARASEKLKNILDVVQDNKEALQSLTRSIGALE